MGKVPSWASPPLDLHRSPVQAGTPRPYLSSSTHSQQEEERGGEAAFPDSEGPAAPLRGGDLSASRPLPAFFHPDPAVCLGGSPLSPSYPHPGLALTPAHFRGRSRSTHGILRTSLLGSGMESQPNQGERCARKHYPSSEKEPFPSLPSKLPLGVRI